MKNKIREITPLSLFLGLLIAVIMTAANVYLGLYAGMTVSASIPAAVIAMGVFGILKRKSILETNIVQTMASAGESLAAGIIFTLPALVIVGAWKDFSFWPTTLIAISGGLLGIVFMIPLRSVLIKNEKELTYPEGIACAAVLRAGSSEQGRQGFILILKGLFLGGLFKFSQSAISLLSPSVEFAKKINHSSFFIGSDLSPALLSVGYIVKLEVAILVFIGGFIGFSIAIPMIGTPIEYMQLSSTELAWSLWSTKVRYLGVGAMIVGGVWSIISVRSGISQGVRGLKAAYNNDQQSISRVDQDMSIIGMMSILLICFLIMLFLYNSLINHLGLSFFTTILMIICSFLFVAVSSYIVGLVGSSNNPVSGMTISALLVSAALFLVLGEKGDSAILSTLGVAAVVCCAACTAGDCSQDLKTGHIIGSTPKNQQLAQVIGVVIPAFTIAPVLSLLHNAYGIGEGLKAPQASLFASITKAMFGSGELPVLMVIMGMCLGILVLFIDNIFLKNKKIRLHLMPLAVGIYLPVTLAYPILIGGLIRFFVDKKRKTADDSKDRGVLLSSGLIAGEAITGVFVALIIYFYGSLYEFRLDMIIKETLSILLFSYLAVYLYKVSRKSL